MNRGVFGLGYVLGIATWLQRQNFKIRRHDLDSKNEIWTYEDSNPSLSVYCYRACRCRDDGSGIRTHGGEPTQALTERHNR